MTEGKAVAIVYNMPEYAMEHQYVVARYDNGLLWFYGAWDDIEQASDIAGKIGNGIVVIPTGFVGDNK